MTQNQIKEIQRKVGAEADGQVGPKTRGAIQAHLKKILDSAPRKFPKAGTEEFHAFWGRHGEPGGYAPPTRKIELPFHLYLYGDKDSPVTSLKPHEKAADAFLEFFQHLAGVYPTQAQREAAGITVYDGLYNPRLMRGSSKTWSMHSWAMAIDLNASENQLRDTWPQEATMPLEVYECAAKAGMTSLGWKSFYDPMHLECVGY